MSDTRTQEVRDYPKATEEILFMKLNIFRVDIGYRSLQQLTIYFSPSERFNQRGQFSIYLRHMQIRGKNLYNKIEKKII